jgi:hypothetical protein
MKPSRSRSRDMPSGTTFVPKRSLSSSLFSLPATRNRS